MTREKTELSPVVLKFGVALMLSLGGVLYSIFRTHRNKAPESSTRLPDEGSQSGSRGKKSDSVKDDHAVAIKHSPRKSCSIVSEKQEASPSSGADDIISIIPSGGKSSVDEDGFLLAEFDEILKEYDLSTPRVGFSPRKHIGMASPDVETPRDCRFVDKEDNEQEIRSLRNLIKILKERERNLEIQLLEYYGLKEQETAVTELQNRLKINNMEAKLLNLKIESLQADKMRLEGQVADYVKVVSELEAAKAKIKLLKKKLMSEVGQNKEQILTLQERVMKLQDHEKRAASTDPDIPLKLQRLKDLEEEAEELRKSNSCLRLENSELSRRLDYIQMFGTSALKDDTEALKEESHHLREQNRELKKEIEQLQADRCTDAEELVYLRWINACLRYELRNYQPGPGKTIARDLSKTLSPKSEEKAKQLILEYANREGSGDMALSITDFESDHWSSSQASYLTDSGELDDSSVYNSSSNKTNNASKAKVFSKLVRLIRGKDNHHSQDSSIETTACIGDIAGRYSCDSAGCSSRTSLGIDSGADGLSNKLRTLSQGSSGHSLSSCRHSLDMQQSFQASGSIKGEDANYLEGARRNSDDGTISIYRTIDYISEQGANSSQENHGDFANFQKSELLKYAAVLKESRSKRLFHGRSASIGSL